MKIGMIVLWDNVSKLYKFHLSILISFGNIRVVLSCHLHVFEYSLIVAVPTVCVWYGQLKIPVSYGTTNGT